jgi:hypothetical protein
MPPNRRDLRLRWMTAIKSYRKLNQRNEKDMFDKERKRKASAFPVRVTRTEKYGRLQGRSLPPIVG